MKKTSILLVILALCTFSFFVWWNNGTSPVESTNINVTTFVVDKGEGIRQIANNLKSRGLIKDPIVFFLLVRQLGLDGKIQAGDFRLSPSFSAEKIARTLTVGTSDIWVTIPEGKRSGEVAKILEDKLSLSEPNIAQKLALYEGYLFPDTYSFPKDVTLETVITTMRNNFANKFATIENTSGRTEKEIVIIASLIEREARHPEDQPLIASVIENRLDIDMPLQIDATVQYAIGFEPSTNSWWKKAVTFDDLKIVSSYNTYTRAGLPPGPIANPGIGALRSAANPASTDYLFYISDSNGVNHYARTLAEHNANIEKYNL